MSLKVVLVGSEFISSQQSYLNNSQSLLESKGITVDTETTSSIKEVKGNGFAIYNGNKLLTSASGVSTKYNWIEIFATFVDNFNNPDLIDGFYAWGQVVPETGEYLCKDCGFVADFEAGDVFPVCEVCQSGEPGSASTPEMGYWEKI
jgi:hypothetical protein